MPGSLTRSPKNTSPSLEKRVRCLESRVEALKARLGIYDPPKETQRKPGPHPKISKEDLLENRDALVDWLEVYWPKVGPKLLSAKGPQSIVAALVLYAGPEASHSFILKRLIENADAKGVVLQGSALKVGDSIRVSAGPFAELLGTLERLDDNNRVRVLLEIMGSKIPVLLPEAAVTPT